MCVADGNRSAQLSGVIMHNRTCSHARKSLWRRRDGKRIAVLPVATHSCVRLRMPKAASNAKQFFEQSKRNALGQARQISKRVIGRSDCGLILLQPAPRLFDNVTPCSGRVVGCYSRQLLEVDEVAASAARAAGTVEVSDVQAALSGEACLTARKWWWRIGAWWHSGGDWPRRHGKWSDQTLCKARSLCGHRRHRC